MDGMDAIAILNSNTMETILSYLDRLSPLSILLSSISILLLIIKYISDQKKLVADKKKAEDKVICEQAILSLERAYDVLTDKGKNTEIPCKDRLIWLRTARLILEYQELKSKLKTDLYKLICDTNEENWRHEFYLLTNDRNLPHSYFQKESKIKAGISPKSAIIVCGFGAWEKGKKDNIHNFDAKEFLLENDFWKHHDSLRDIIYTYPKHLGLDDSGSFKQVIIFAISLLIKIRLYRLGLLLIPN